MYSWHKKPAIFEICITDTNNKTNFEWYRTQNVTKSQIQESEEEEEKDENVSNEKIIYLCHPHLYNLINKIIM